MGPQAIYISSNTAAPPATRTLQGDPLPYLVGILGTELVVKVAFHTAGEIAPLAGGSTGRLIVKAQLDYDGSGLLPTTALVFAGSGIEARGTLTALCDSVQLEELLANKPFEDFIGQVEWTPGGTGTPHKSLPFVVRIINSAARLGDGAPDPAADAAWEWLKARLVEGAGVTLTEDDEAKTITVAATLPTTAAPLTARTGGAAGALDAVLTASGAVATGNIATVVTGSPAAAEIWQLQSGTDAEDATGGIVRPDDYNASTNARVWRKVL